MLYLARRIWEEGDNEATLGRRSTAVAWRSAWDTGKRKIAADAAASAEPLPWPFGPLRAAGYKQKNTHTLLDTVPVPVPKPVRVPCLAVYWEELHPIYHNPWVFHTAITDTNRANPDKRAYASC